MGLSIVDKTGAVPGGEEGTQYMTGPINCFPSMIISELRCVTIMHTISRF